MRSGHDDGGVQAQNQHEHCGSMLDHVADGAKPLVPVLPHPDWENDEQSSEIISDHRRYELLQVGAERGARQR